jgi:hypothetical protein
MPTASRRKKLRQKNERQKNKIFATEPSLESQFGRLRTNPDMVTERERIATYLDAEPDKTLALVAEMDMGEPELPPGATVTYVCPMHPEVIRDEPGRCPKCNKACIERLGFAALFVAFSEL